MTTKNKHAVELGRRGGRVSSPRKTAAARANAQKGGRPPKYDVEGDVYNATARITMRDSQGVPYPLRKLSAASLAALAKWMKTRIPHSAVVAFEDGRLHFG